MYKPVWDKTFGPCCCHYCYTFTTDHTLAGWVSPVWGKCPHRLKRATLLHNKRAVAILNYSSNVTMVLQCLQSRAGPSIASLTLLRFASLLPTPMWLSLHCSTGKKEGWRQDPLSALPPLGRELEQSGAAGHVGLRGTQMGFAGEQRV